MRNAGERAAILCMVVALAFPSRIARADSHEDSANQVVFVGLLPLKKSDDAPDLVGLKTAQHIREVAERALATTTHSRVFGHQELTQRLGTGYLPKWFDCKDDVTCLVRLLTPLRDIGNRLAIAGAYNVDGATYHVRLISFFIADGTVGKEIKFDLGKDEIEAESKWSTQLELLLPSRLGRVRVGMNVADATCTLDGNPCTFESDGRTLSAPPGEHTIELSKEGYLPEKVIVHVETGTTQEIAVALKPTAKQVATVRGPRHAPSLDAVRTDKIVEIDGKLDEPAWQKAWVESNFVQNYPNEGKDPSEQTELRVLYDDEALYIGIRCYDREPRKIVSRLTRRDRDIDADKVVVSISSKNDKASAFTFQVNAANVQVDGTRFNDTDASTDWDGIWYSETSRDDKGWIAELAIPLAALRYSGDATSFGFQVRRYVERRQEIDEWSYVPRDAQGEVSYYGTLEGLTGVHAPRLVQIVPYDSRSITSRTQQGPLDGYQTGGRFGADIKIGITPALALDATVNPDFGTVEVDQVVLNLSTFETFFPEKRPFFLEGADLFTTPFQLFYSRRIGKTPADTAVAGTQVAPTPEGQILSAVKLTGLLASRLSIAALDAVTEREDEIVQRAPDQPRESVLVEPLTNFAVLRLRQEFSQNSWIGVMGTAVNRFEPANAAAPQPGDGCPMPYFGVLPILAPVKGRCTNDAYTGGIDTVLRTSDGTWGASGQVVGSLLEDGPGRLLPDGTLIRPGDPGWGLTARAGKYGGEHWLFDGDVDYVTPKLDVNDVGFGADALPVGPSRNQLHLDANLVLRTTKPAFGFQYTQLKLTYRYRAFADTGKPASAGKSPALIWTGVLPSFWSLFAFLGPILPNYSERETRDGALSQSPLQWGWTFEITSDPRKAVTVDLIVMGQTTARGVSNLGTLTLGIRPASFIELDLISDATWSYGDPRWVDTEPNPDGSRTYFFQDLDSREWDALLRGTVTISPALSLQMYAQLFGASGHYGKATQAIGSGGHPVLDFDQFTPASVPPGVNADFIETELNVNAFLRWQYRAGSALWVAYTRNQLNTPYDPMLDGAGRLRFDKVGGPSTDVFLVKLSYLWEPFSRRR
jgi:hypothetical protein